MRSEYYLKIGYDDRKLTHYGYKIDFCEGGYISADESTVIYPKGGRTGHQYEIHQNRPDRGEAYHKNVQMLAELGIITKIPPYDQEV